MEVRRTHIEFDDFGAYEECLDDLEMIVLDGIMTYDESSAARSEMITGRTA